MVKNLFAWRYSQDGGGDCSFAKLDGSGFLEMILSMIAFAAGSVEAPMRTKCPSLSENNNGMLCKILPLLA